jgi:transcriptional pleiotropic regulator of transition state genes
VGTARRIDQLGRIVIPAALRHALNINDGDLVDIDSCEGAIVVTKAEPACVLCGAPGDLRLIRDRCLCEKCIREIRRDDDRVSSAA